MSARDAHEDRTCLVAEDGIEMATLGGARATGMEDRIGSIEVGKYADLVVLAADPRAIPPEDIQNLEVRATFLAGQQVYGQALVSH